MRRHVLSQSLLRASAQAGVGKRDLRVWWGGIEFLPLLSAQGTTVTRRSPFWGVFDVQGHEAIRPQDASSACFHDLAFTGGSNHAIGGVRLRPGSRLEGPGILRLECLARLQSSLRMKESIYFKKYWISESSECRIYYRLINQNDVCTNGRGL